MSDCLASDICPMIPMPVPAPSSPTWAACHGLATAALPIDPAAPEIALPNEPIMDAIYMPYI